ncbi:zinc-dependent alcohol dehydrogenase family protein [bacterium]|nr:zinc-dependent alcohol dehydrogenase family protein [bacterium]
MKAMVIQHVTDLQQNSHPLHFVEIRTPTPGRGEVLIRVSACGVCHTELDEIEGRTPPAFFPMIPGHQVIGRIEDMGADVNGLAVGDRVGVAWIFSSCGECEFCKNGYENLCRQFKATGRDALGGYAEWMIAPAASVFPIPDFFTDTEAAPLLCAGAIGFRSLRLTEIENGQSLGLMGFGASAHLVIQMVRFKFPDTPVFVFARSEKERAFARELGAVWTGSINDSVPVALHAIIDSTPAWQPVVAAMKNLNPGGRLIVNAIRKENHDKNNLLSLNYPEHLWMEKEIKSVANVTRRDVADYLVLASTMKTKPETNLYSLTDANHALIEMKKGEIRGAKVLVIE